MQLTPSLFSWRSFSDKTFNTRTHVSLVECCHGRRSYHSVARRLSLVLRVRQRLAGLAAAVARSRGRRLSVDRCRVRHIWHRGRCGRRGRRCRVRATAATSTAAAGAAAAAVGKVAAIPRAAWAVARRIAAVSVAIAGAADATAAHECPQECEGEQRQQSAAHGYLPFPKTNCGYNLPW